MILLHVLPLTACILIKANSGANSSVQANNSFKIFNAINFRDTPDLSQHGLSEINIVYEDALLSPADDPIYKVIDRKKFKQQVSLARRSPKVPTCLDVESWPLFDGEEKREQSVRLYLKLLKEFKRQTGQTNVSLFAFSANIPEIAEESEILFPGFYNYIYGKDKWYSNSQVILANIRKYNKTAPIYGFVCPQYINNAPGIPDSLYYSYLSYEDWKFQLETMFEFCDGLVIWTYPYRMENGKLNFFTWDPDLPWWRATLDFIEEKQIAIN